MKRKENLANKWVRLAISIISLSVIIGIYEAIKDPLFNWSVLAIENIETKSGNGLKYTSMVISWFGANVPNVIVICIFVAMFKRRNQAFSYLALWFMQVFINSFFKLALRQARPSMVIADKDNPDIPWTSFN